MRILTWFCRFIFGLRSNSFGFRPIRYGFPLAIVLVASLVFLLFSHSAWGAVVPSDPVPLTLEMLQERVKFPIQSDGMRTIDLRRLVIDLRPENAPFRDQFYRLLQTSLQRSAVPVGLDLSDSLIQGEFDGNQLGLRTPLYGQSLLPNLTPTEQAQLQRDRRRLSQLRQLSRSLLVAPGGDSDPTGGLQLNLFRGPLKLIQTRFNGPVKFTNTFFLNRVESQGTLFTQSADWSQTRFSQPTTFANGIFGSDAQFRNTIFFARVSFSQAQFQGNSYFQGSEFQSTASFNRVIFQKQATFSRSQWQGNADFAQVLWKDRALFNRSQFGRSLFLTEATAEQLLSFREAQFNLPVNLRGASLLGQADFSDVGFAKGAYLNIPDLHFDPDQARIVGDPGQIGRVFSVPALQGNENLLRNLVRNFRGMEQIKDANQVEYTTERLRLRELGQQIVGTNLNAASPDQLLRVGFSPVQVQEILDRRAQQPFRSLPELLALKEVDLATYIKIRNQVIAGESLAIFSRILAALNWLGLSLLLLLSRYGTSSWLVFGGGLVMIAWFGVLFWLVDRLRRFRPKPIVPTLTETIWMLSSFVGLTLAGTLAIFRTADQPWLTITCLAIVVIPVPTLLLGLIYWRGRYHDLLEVSYFVEEGSLRQIRLLIGRLPVIPRFPMFRERYLPILWDRRWNWLNYYDFSFNNLLKLGFNDVRVRDEHLPGLITGLVWYQWCLGILYIALLLWTFSRTIPGLNLLIYFR